MSAKEVVWNSGERRVIFVAVWKKAQRTQTAWPLSRASCTQQQSDTLKYVAVGNLFNRSGPSHPSEGYLECVLKQNYMHV